MHKVAIGLPVWNGQAFISEAIELILGQTYADLELLISDNASTDATAEICHAYAKHDSRIRYIRQKQNIGAGPNFVQVFRLSSSIYFKWAAHDDILAPQFIEECVRVLDVNDSVVVCFPATVLINEDGSPVGYSIEHNAMVDSVGRHWPLTPENNAQLTSADPADRFAAVLLNTFMALEIFGLIRRSALERTSVMPSHFGGDKIVLAELGVIGPFRLLETLLFYRRCHAGQYTQIRSARSATTWFFGNESRVYVHQLRLLTAYTRVALSAGLTTTQKSRCISAILRRAVSRGQPLRRMFVPIVD